MVVFPIHLSYLKFCHTQMQIILTHEHADAILGLDDIRRVQPFSPTNDIVPMPVYLTQFSMDRYSSSYLHFCVFTQLAGLKNIFRIIALPLKFIFDGQFYRIDYSSFSTGDVFF